MAMMMRENHKDSLMVYVLYMAPRSLLLLKEGFLSTSHNLLVNEASRVSKMK